jgi:hypothetical protein
MIEGTAPDPGAGAVREAMRTGVRPLADRVRAPSPGRLRAPRATANARGATPITVCSHER